MSDPTREQLQRAYELAKSGRRMEAIHLLQQVILVDDRNVNAWWLMANLTESPADKRVALDHVLALNPNHSKARQMLARIVERYPELARKPSVLPTAPREVRPKRARPRPAARPKPHARGRRRLLIGAIVVILVVVVVIVVALLLAT